MPECFIQARTFKSLGSKVFGYSLYTCISTSLPNNQVREYSYREHSHHPQCAFHVDG